MLDGVEVTDDNVVCQQNCTAVNSTQSNCSVRNSQLVFCWDVALS